jgi:hydroxypyruvate reductase/glycerate 2-kinase
VTTPLREQAISIWRAAVDAVRPEGLIRPALTGGSPADPGGELPAALAAARRVLVVGGGKAGAAMAAAVEDALADRLDRLGGAVNVPAGSTRPLRSIRLHAARPAGSNQPTGEGVAGVEAMLQLASGAGPEDVGLCLISGGGSALLPAPVPEVGLADKQAVTKLLHECGASINEMNAVRKHLSRVKGGRLAEAFRGGRLFSLILSDVVGDPLDVIASGPTAPDPTTFSDALAVLERFRLTDRAPPSVLRYLREGAAGRRPETPKQLPGTVRNLLVGNNQIALRAATRRAEELGYRVLNLGSFIEGETTEVAAVVVGLVRSIRRDGLPLAPPACVLLGGETTVTLAPGHGRGGRNQEFALAALARLGAAELRGLVVLSGGTDGEDGPTDAAGAVADEVVNSEATWSGFSPREFLARHDAYPFFDRTGGLLRTGLTDTNVMDVRVVLIA